MRRLLAIPREIRFLDREIDIVSPTAGPAGLEALQARPFTLGKRSACGGSVAFGAISPELGDRGVVVK